MSVHPSWGSGWPNCQYGKVKRDFQVKTKWGIVKFPGGIREELAELVARLVQECSRRGYRFGIPGDASYGCWGFMCRAIRGTNRASRHSWAIAIDINAPRNPMGDRLITDMPDWMPDLFNAYGFRWGGDYSGRKDAMHYEFMGSVKDAKRLTELARKNRLGEDRRKPKPETPEPKPEPKKVQKMLHLVKGNQSDEWWVTDNLTKRRVVNQEDANIVIYTTVVGGGLISRAEGNKPHVWPQWYVDKLDEA